MPCRSTISPYMYTAVGDQDHPRGYTRKIYGYQDPDVLEAGSVLCCVVQWAETSGIRILPPEHRIFVKHRYIALIPVKENKYESWRYGPGL